MSKQLPKFSHARYKKLIPEEVNYIVVHCSATEGTKDFGAYDIDRWHRERGWLSIGYHYVIRLDGSIEEGRSVEDRGAHVQGHNHESIGICLIGGLQDGVPTATFTEDQYRNLRVLVQGLQILFPNAKVVGHRDFPGVDKECPCFEVGAWVNTWDKS